MARTYNEVSAGRRGRLSKAGEAQRDVFAGVYALAMQVIELREKHGLTQAELAKRSGIDQGDISRIERGSAMPNERTLLRIANALDADLRIVAR